ncbi:MAG TPA: hypothetical protein VHW25_17050 [Steroidobacteraceae bacterium]|nr:hypothetical protein [Steroidobacteraceae bacterium]
MDFNDFGLNDPEKKANSNEVSSAERATVKQILQRERPAQARLHVAVNPSESGHAALVCQGPTMARYLVALHHKCRTSMRIFHSCRPVVKQVVRRKVWKYKQMGTHALATAALAQFLQRYMRADWKLHAH